MRIAHLCLSCFYIDNFSYQENILPRQNKMDGHDVLIIASTETYTANKKLGYVSSGQYINEDGIRVIRLGYNKILPRSIMKKLRIHNGVLRLLEDFNPEVILFHGLCGWELLSAVTYKKLHPQVKLYADSHEDENNSARNIISRVLLHKVYYRSILTYALQYINKILCISLETIAFVKKVYGIPNSMLEFFPLGGVIYSDEDYNKKRMYVRALLGLVDDDILFIQAGKMGKQKKVIESISAFRNIQGNNLKLVLVGSIDDEIRDEVDSLLMTSNNVFYLGWKVSAELMDYLCAADVYLQPGSQSAIMQNALCLRCAAILDDVPSHQPFIDGNGWLLNKDVTLATVLGSVLHNPTQLKQMSESSLAIARRVLDYSKLATRLYD